VATAEQLQEASRRKSVLTGLNKIDGTHEAMIKVGYEMVEEMSEACELDEECLNLVLKIASHHELELRKEGDLGLEILALPLLERESVFKLELGLWRRRLDVLAYKQMLEVRKRNIFNQNESDLSSPMRRGYNDIACRELDIVLRRRDRGELEGTSLGSLEGLVSFALEAWTCMEPHPSELVDTCLQSVMTSERIKRWLEEEAYLESLVKWRLLRAARSERLSADDFDLSAPARVGKTFMKRPAKCR
jgi:hypothetical protein